MLTQSRSIRSYIEMEVPGLGKVINHQIEGWYYCQPISVPMLDGKFCRIVLKGYAADERKEDFHTAIAHFLAGNPATLREADSFLFQFYKDCEKRWLADGEHPIAPGDELWQYVRLGDEPMVSRRAYGDRGIYISLECGCDWEREHGLQLVLKNGLKLSKLGNYDGHLTHSDYYDDESLEHVIYPFRNRS